MGELEDPVAVILMLQRYREKLSSQVEQLRQDIALCKTFQTKYGPGAWKQSNDHLNKALSARVNMLKEVQFQLDLVAAGMKQGKALCQKLGRLLGPTEHEVDVSTSIHRRSAADIALGRAA
mmetsp:Transcript_7369/g.17749  ORF Transcript_7369/g.17749 Transcript_7369/m.17749 type:complete len:121 (+) Transcript_7369:181-543(+)|eukprot:CAMPEP_0180120228 /NCGR_PEP_ID=MMETSP0986-20121125/2405_1 /TAXON_ID=697907 /ORGANISM="non described non described, Strain CCMP2293" /LENGTH=120 /DNA_ID=CAMNT_0022059285 /DNA_START=103 /DNA_END=465 /DNA_ORIENTATION=-